jgi:hypothetical protein
LRVISLWRHKFCYLTTPLLRADYARETLAAFFDWLARGEHGCPLLKLDWIAGEGKVYHALVDYLHATGAMTLVTERFTRALFKPSADSETYLRSALSRFRLKEYRRQERRLMETGVSNIVRLRRMAMSRLGSKSFYIRSRKLEGPRRTGNSLR